MRVSRSVLLATAAAIMSSGAALAAGTDLVSGTAARLAGPATTWLADILGNPEASSGMMIVAGLLTIGIAARRQRARPNFA